MRSFDQPEPLTDAALDRLGEFLRKCKGGKAMNIEEIDGFFSALIAGPEVMLPSEYLPEVFGGEMTDTCEFAGIDEANDILGLNDAALEHDCRSSVQRGRVFTDPV